MTASWLEAVDPAFVDRRFGVEAVNAALAASRVYVDPPALGREGQGTSRLVAAIAEAPGGRRLGSPYKLAVRFHGDVLDVACACRRGRICDHVVWLLVDVAFDPELRATLLAGGSAAPDPATRSVALEQRTLDDRLSAWLPPRAFDDDFELDVDVGAIASAALAGGESRAAVFLRHRRPKNRALVPARDVLGARLRPRHRALVDLTAPYHLDKNVLVATRGQAAVLVELLKGEIGVFAEGFKARLRFAAEPVAPRLERDGERLVARWFAGGAAVADASDALVVAGPTPWLWVAPARTFHPIAPGVDLDLARGLERVPSLPLGEEVAAGVGRALWSRSRGLGVGLPPPEAFGLPPLEAPTFELRIGGTPLELRAELLAVYRAAKIKVGLDDADAGRDLDAEERALARARAAGLEPDETDPGWLRASEERAVRFWQNLDSLRRDDEVRFEVLLGDAVARAAAGLGRVVDLEVDVRVSAETGWLEAQLEFRAAALGVEIARLHETLAANKRWIVLSDGSFARLRDEVAALVAESADLVGDRGQGRLPPHQFGRIARWIELADGSGGGLRVHVDPAIGDLRARLRDLARHPERARLPAALAATLRPYQRIGVAWLQLLRGLGAGGLLADDMGLGKTLMTLAFLAGWIEDERGGEGAPSLVVCPTSVVGNWGREAERFTPGLRVGVWHGAGRRDRASELGHHDLVVTTYGVLRRDAELLAKTQFRLVVLDEAQNIKNPASDTARAARQLDARMRLALTGTPVENRLSELWSLMTFANPGILGTAAEFDFHFERALAARSDAAAGDELRAVVRPFILRRTKAEVLPDLPPKTEIERSCVFGLRQKRLYDALALALRETIARDPERRKGARTQLTVLTAILRLRQMACDPRLVDPEARPEESAKRAEFLELVRELVSEGRRALVFSQFVELLALWRQDLDLAKVGYETLDGSTPAAARAAIVQRFQEGSAPLMLVSLKAGGAGLNLTAADTVIHCDPWWNAAAEDQATDRAHRIGQDKPVTVVRLVAKGTIEDKIALLKAKKSELAAAVLDGDDGASAFGRELAYDDELLALLGDVEGDAADDA